MKVLVDKELLDKLLASAEQQETNGLGLVPNKHRKFAAEWDRLGRPQLEYKTPDIPWTYVKDQPLWNEDNDYRFKYDSHWELRLKWINSDKTLPIEYNSGSGWRELESNEPLWMAASQYREAIKKWEPPDGTWVIDLADTKVYATHVFSDEEVTEFTNNGLVRQKKEHAKEDLELIRKFCRTLAWMRDKGIEPDESSIKNALVDLAPMEEEKDLFLKAIKSGGLEL